MDNINPCDDFLSQLWESDICMNCFKSREAHLVSPEGVGTTPTYPSFLAHEKWWETERLPSLRVSPLGPCETLQRQVCQFAEDSEDDISSDSCLLVEKTETKSRWHNESSNSDSDWYSTTDEGEVGLSLWLIERFYRNWIAKENSLRSFSGAITVWGLDRRNQSLFTTRADLPPRFSCE